MKKLAFIKFGGLASGGTEINFQNIAKQLSLNYKVDYFYCDAAPYIGSDWKHPDTDSFRKNFLENSKVNLIKFHVGFKDITNRHHKWINSDFWDKFNEESYDLIFASGSGHPEYPFTKILKKPIFNYVNLNAGVNNQKNIIKTICNSSFTAKEWLSQGGDGNRLEIIPVCRESFQYSDDSLVGELNLNNKFVYGLHQRNDDEIYSQVPLKAFKKISNAKNFFLMLGGSRKYSIQAKKLNIRNFIQLPHSADNEVINKFLNTLNVYTHGRKYGETFGLAITEAMSYGLPVISHKAESNAHVDVVGDCGKVFEKWNTYSYSKEMYKLENDKKYYLEKSNCSKQKFLSEFSENAILKLWSNLVKDFFD